MGLEAFGHASQLTHNCQQLPLGIEVSSGQLSAELYSSTSAEPVLVPPPFLLQSYGSEMLTWTLFFFLSNWPREEAATKC